MHNQENFRHTLAQENFLEVVEIQKAANLSVDLHSHAFDAKGLITQGSITIGVNGVESTYQVGDVFHLNANVIHTERYGSDGATYLVGRRR